MTPRMPRASDQPEQPSVVCLACEGEGIGGGFVPELCGEGEDHPCEPCNGTGSIVLPSKHEVCPQCEGHGMSSAWLGAFTADDWRDLDEDFRHGYLAGHFDRRCETCKGLRVVAVPDEGRCDPDLLRRYQDALMEAAEERRILALESGWGYDRGCGF